MKFNTRLFIEILVLSFIVNIVLVGIGTPFSLQLVLSGLLGGFSEKIFSLLYGTKQKLFINLDESEPK